MHRLLIGIVHYTDTVPHVLQNRSNINTNVRLACAKQTDDFLFRQSNTSVVRLSYCGKNLPNGNRRALPGSGRSLHHIRKKDMLIIAYLFCL